MRYALKRACNHHLRTTFGMENYRPGQKAAVHALLSSRDVMCILPTGAGKSLCWQLPAVVHEGLTVVVSPLIALMRDQVQHLQANGIPAVSLDSLMEDEEKNKAIRCIRQGLVRIVFVAPERLAQPRFVRLCTEMAPWLVVVDEAHCVMQWGENFRPAYMGIRAFVDGLPRRPVVCALTATADVPMQRSVAASLGMKRAKRILMPVIRPNLIYRVRTTLDRTGEILRILRDHPCKTVIFCRSRARTEYLAECLQSYGVNAAGYHAGLDRNDRMRAQQWFHDGRECVLCATTAFGLGVDIPDIRRVIHDYLPDNLIDYVQQTGRAGRDAQDAECILLVDPNDLVSKAFVTRSVKAKDPFRRWFCKRKKIRDLHQLLRVMLQVNCIPAGISAAFGKGVPDCGRCSACSKGPLMEKVPSLGRMRQHQIRTWLLLWQRDALAVRGGVRPGQILSDKAIKTAAKHLAFPGGEHAPDEMERLLAHMRGQRMNTADGDGVY